MIYYVLVKTIVNIFKLRNGIINMVICYHGLLDLIIINKGYFFI